MLSLELGAPRLAYGFALAAGTSVDSPRREFLNSSQRGGDSGKAKLSQLPKKKVVAFIHFAPCRK
jgi:hypothetical protein